MSIEHYWYIPLNTEQSLVEENLKLDITGDLGYIDGNISGVITITNNGPSIQNLSSGTYPVNLGISIIDEAGAVIDQDFQHLSIKPSGILKKGGSVNIAIDLPDMSGYVESGYGVRLEIVQEAVSWMEETAQYYWFK